MQPDEWKGNGIYEPLMIVTKNKAYITRYCRGSDHDGNKKIVDKKIEIGKRLCAIASKQNEYYDFDE